MQQRAAYEESLQGQTSSEKCGASFLQHSVSLLQSHAKITVTVSMKTFQQNYSLKVLKPQKTS